MHIVTHVNIKTFACPHETQRIRMWRVRNSLDFSLSYVIIEAVKTICHITYPIMNIINLTVLPCWADGANTLTA